MGVAASFAEMQESSAVVLPCFGIEIFTCCGFRWSRVGSVEGWKPLSSDPLNDLDEFVTTVSLTSGQTNQFPRFGNEDGLLRGIAHHGDTSSSAELQKPFLTKLAKRPEHRVRVDPEHGSQVSGRRQSFTWEGFPVADGPADLCRNLLMQGGQFVKVNLDMDTQHGDN